MEVQLEIARRLSWSAGGHTGIDHEADERGDEYNDNRDEIFIT